MNPRNWLHPADIVSASNTIDDGEEQLWRIFTDDNKSEQGLGSGEPQKSQPPRRRNQKESSNPEQKELQNRIEMGESSRQNLRKQNRRSTCKGDNSKLLRNIQQDTKKCFKKWYLERKHNKMAKSLGGNSERSYY